MPELNEYCTVPVSIIYRVQKDNKTLSNLNPEEQISTAADLTEQLIQATEPQNNKSLLPNDLGVSARILTAVVDVLENNNATDEV